jgi:uncharacterized Ntn-hydrolase superfamily protein
MTWSIVARDAESGAFAVAVTSKFFAVGALCPYAQSGVGALATQALVNPTYGPLGLRLLAEDRPAARVLELLLAADEGREARQVQLVDRAGRIAAHTGRDCVGWCGHVAGEDFAVAGNMLAGPAVVAATADAFRSAAGRPLAERLLAGLDAGQAQGGDKRGKQSAALLVYHSEDYPYLDLRVDDHAEPLDELARLYRESHRVFLPLLDFLPSRANPAGIHDRAVIDAALKRTRDAPAE